MHRHRSVLSFALLLVSFVPLGWSAHAQTAAKPAQASATAPSSQSLDLNTATPAQLKTLPGIGDAYAKRIVEGRPYSAKNQLVTKGILPAGTYEKIKNNIVAHRAPKHNEARCGNPCLNAACKVT